MCCNLIYELSTFVLLAKIFTYMLFVYCTCLKYSIWWDCWTGASLGILAPVCTSISPNPFLPRRFAPFGFRGAFFVRRCRGRCSRHALNLMAESPCCWERCFHLGTPHCLLSCIDLVIEKIFCDKHYESFCYLSFGFV